MEISATDVLNRLGVNYTVKGSSLLFHCVNPDHMDENPSMSMNAEGIYQCWSCGVKGNLHTFIKFFTDKGLYEFMNVANPYSYEFKASLKKPERMSFDEAKGLSFRMNGSLHTVHDNTDVMKYLQSIAIDNKVIRAFNIQYTDFAYMSFLPSGKMTLFKNRVCVPVYENGVHVNEIGRDYTGTGTLKELYPKGGKTDTFFNIDAIDFDLPVVIVEGFKGLIRIWKHFTKNVMSSFGSTLGVNQIELIKNIPNLLLFIDNDKAGYEMADKVLAIRERDFSITAMPVKGHDPADGPLNELRYAFEHIMSSVNYDMKINGFKTNNSLRWY